MAKAQSTPAAASAPASAPAATALKTSKTQKTQATPTTASPAPATTTAPRKARVSTKDRAANATAKIIAKHEAEKAAEQAKLEAQQAAEKAAEWASHWYVRFAAFLGLLKVEGESSVWTMWHDWSTARKREKLVDAYVKDKGCTRKSAEKAVDKALLGGGTSDSTGTTSPPKPPKAGTKIDTNKPTPQVEGRKAPTNWIPVAMIVGLLVMLGVVSWLIINTLSHTTTQTVASTSSAEFGSAIPALYKRGATDTSTPSTIPASYVPSGASITTSITTWKMGPANHAGHRWVAEGIPAIMETRKRPQKARSAALVWAKIISGDAGLLADASTMVLHRPVSPASLVDSASMATTVAVQINRDLVAVLSDPLTKITAMNVPKGAYNTGVVGRDGALVRSAGPGITGNRWGLKVVTAAGDVFYILGRCGNIAAPSTPNLPAGKTDNGYKPPHKPPRDHNNAKDGSLDPSARGHATTGGGRNQDSGSGNYQSPNQVTHPPATARVNPTPPPATVVPAGSKPDPTPAPAPENAASTPAAPATGRSHAAGR